MNPRRNPGWASPLGRWVESYGSTRLAFELGVRPETIYHWIAGRSSPAPRRGLAIVRLSKGAISFRTLYPRPLDFPAEAPRCFAGDNPPPQQELRPWTST